MGDKNIISIKSRANYGFYACVTGDRIFSQANVTEGRHGLWSKLKDRDSLILRNPGLFNLLTLGAIPLV